MSHAAEAHLRKAYQRLKEAEGMLSLGYAAATLNRTYYAMFEAASALLARVGVEVESHEGLKIKFGELLVKTGKVEARFSRYLKRAYDLRDDADYALDERAYPSVAVGEGELIKAREFVAMSEEFLKSEGGTSNPGSGVP